MDRFIINFNINDYSYQIDYYQYDVAFIINNFIKVMINIRKSVIVMDDNFNVVNIIDFNNSQNNY